MDGDRIFKGTIAYTNPEIIGYQSLPYSKGKYSNIPIRKDIYKKNAVLIKVKENSYIDLDEINGNIDLFKKTLKKEVLTTDPNTKNDKYVKKESLRPYYAQKGEKTNVKQLKLNKKALDIRH